MKLDICKACKHCEVSPRPGAPLSDVKRQHYHCMLANPQPIPESGGIPAFTQENPTNFIAEEFDERRIIKGTNKLETVRVTKFKELFKIPAKCPHRNEH